MSATATSYAHAVARLAQVDAEHLLGLSVKELDVLYFGILSDDASPSFRSTVTYLDTEVLELYAMAGHMSSAERAYCRCELARRHIRAGIH